MLKSIINLNKKKFSIDSILLINLTLAFFPISFILGSLTVNVNLLLICSNFLISPLEFRLEFP